MKGDFLMSVKNKKYWRMPKQDVYRLFTLRNFMILGEYFGAHEKIPCLCFKHIDKGIQYKTYNSLKSGKGCKFCKNEKLSRDRRGYTLEEVKSIFLLRKCTLVSTEYINVDSKLDYICSCGKPHSKTLWEFRINKSTCDECEKKLNSKENHWNWQGGVTPENEIIRKSKKYIKWRDNVYSRDSYTCQCCLIQGGKLNAHHIESFATNENIRLNVDNGITLSEDCHIQGKPNSFHTRYGHFDNNEEQLIKYINERRMEFVYTNSIFYFLT
jgi:hypothetical protein